MSGIVTPVAAGAGMSKKIASRVASAFAAAIAAASEPAPESFVLETVNVAALAAVGSASEIRTASVAARERPCMGARSSLLGRTWSNPQSEFTHGAAAYTAGRIGRTPRGFVRMPRRPVSRPGALP